jgi:hypothetical protein
LNFENIYIKTGEQNLEKIEKNLIKLSALASEDELNKI